jgi:hypothetical protein
LQTVVVTAQRKVPSEFTGYINFPNHRSGSIASFKDYPLSFSQDRSNDLLDSWVQGYGAENRIYLPSRPMTQALKSAYQINRARIFFYKRYLTNYKNGISLRVASVIFLKNLLQAKDFLMLNGIKIRTIFWRKPE